MKKKSNDKLGFEIRYIYVLTNFRRDRNNAMRKGKDAWEGTISYYKS